MLTSVTQARFFTVILPWQLKDTLQCQRQRVGSVLTVHCQVLLWQVPSSGHVSRTKIFVDALFFNNKKAHNENLYGLIHEIGIN